MVTHNQIPNAKYGHIVVHSKWILSDSRVLQREALVSFHTKCRITMEAENQKRFSGSEKLFRIIGFCQVGRKKAIYISIIVINLSHG